MFSLACSVNAFLWFPNMLQKLKYEAKYPHWLCLLIMSLISPVWKTKHMIQLAFKIPFHTLKPNGQGGSVKKLKSARITISPIYLLSYDVQKAEEQIGRAFLIKV